MKCSIALLSVLSHAISVPAALACSSDEPCYPSETDQNEYEYTIRKGDDLGSVIYEHSKGALRLWGRKGAIKQTLKLNSRVLKKADFLIPNMKIRLPIPAVISHAPTPAIAIQPEPLPNGEAAVDIPLYSSFSLGAVMDFWKIGAEDRITHTTANITSRSSYGARAGYEQQLSRRFGFALFAQTLRSDFERSKQSYVIQQPSLWQFDFRGEFQVFLASRKTEATLPAAVKIGAGYNRAFYVQRVSSNILSLASGWAPRLHLGVTLPLIDTTHYLWATEAQIAALMPVTVGGTAMNGGWDLSGQTFLRRRIQWLHREKRQLFIEAGMSGRMQKQTSYELSYNRLNFGLFAGTGMNF